MAHHPPPWPNPQRSHLHAQGGDTGSQRRQEGKVGTPPPNPELLLLLSTVLLMVTNLLISVLRSPGYKYICKGFQRSQEENGMDFVPDWPFVLTELWYLSHLIMEIMRKIRNPSWSWGPQW